MLTYPTLRLNLLQPLLDLRAAFEDDPGVLGEACPYDPDTVRILIDLFRVPAAVVEERTVETREGGVGRPKGKPALSQLREQTQAAAEGELITLRAELDTLRKEALKMPIDVRVSVIKTSLGLVEKLTLLADRHTNIKKMTQYQAVVISILDDLIEPDARTVFMARLGPYIEDGE